MIHWIFNTKWKRMWEKNRDKIEDMGYDKWITSPLDLTDKPIITNPKMWQAMMEEAESFINTPWMKWK